MQKCPTCGVYVENARICPLCGEPLAPTDEQGATGEPSRDQSPFPAAEDPDGALSSREGNEQTVHNAKIWLFEMVSLAAFTVGIIVFAADFGFGFRVTWSTYPLAGVVFAWLFTTAVIVLTRRRVALIGAETAIVAALLLFISTVSGGTGWFMGLALPITLLLGAIIAITSIIVKLTRLRALAIVATVVLTLGFFLVGLDITLSAHLGSDRPLSWSLVAFTCTLSLFFLILAINKRLREHHSDFRRVFHI